MDTLQTTEAGTSVSDKIELNNKRVNEIINFMKGLSIFSDPEVILDYLQVNIDAVSEEQIMFMITRMSLKQAPIKETFNALIRLPTQDISILNLDSKNLHYFIMMIGAFFYGRAIMRLISKQDITEVKKILGDEAYKHIVHFGKHECKDNYPLQSPFEEKFHAVGYRIYASYFADFSDILKQINQRRTEYEPPSLDVSRLKISKEYGLQLIRIVQDLILDAK